MVQPPGLGDRRLAPGQRLVGKSQTEEDEPQIGLRRNAGMNVRLLDQREVPKRIMEPQGIRQMRPGCDKFAAKHQYSTRGGVTQDECGGIVVPAAQTQQILGKSLRTTEFATENVIIGLSMGDLQKLRRETDAF